jgi:hypothetical protein
MEKFDLSRLNAFSFERMIRAMCFEMMGPLGTVYSSGPDGARDFTIEGQIRGYEGRNWNGYLIIQAKFREQVQGGVADARWLQKQLAGEHKKFQSKEANLRRPDYYIIATNVSLSGTDGASGKGKPRIGGHTRISNHLAGWKGDIGLQDFDIWGGDKIVDLLAQTINVRQTYAAWITTGDVFTAMLQNINGNTLEFSSVIARGLKESLRRDQHARLKDAGSVIDSPVRVSQVFIDLPIAGETSYDELVNDFLESSANQPSTGLISRLALRAQDKLDPESLAIRRKEHEVSNPSPNKIVVLGGPGQGKSTAGLFLAQLFRANILASDGDFDFDDNVRHLVPEILNRAAKEGVITNLPKRYPVFVSLPRFADAISRARDACSSIPSLLTHIANELAQSCDSEVNKDDLRRWLKTYPWVTIFDGLDEVPATGERDAILDAIAAFSTETSNLRADVLLIVMTRPQGYNHDLGSMQWEHWPLIDLPAERAEAYAKALGEARYPSDQCRREEILSSIRLATTRAATSHLMISPLQVTIMYLIVDTGGSVPAARWSLFNEYFEVLKKREKAKGGANQKTLERNWTHLGPIHQRAGLVLQTQSENAGGALSFLAPSRFDLMLRAYLKISGYAPSEIASRADELNSVALDRLVLLSSREEGKISFDVRSLQEFMAAAALTSGTESDIENRLIHIAALTHWRHVFLISASRCFSEDSLHHLRSQITTIPRAIETNLPELIIRSRASLALEMLIDGIGTDHPTSRRILAQHALEVLELGPSMIDERMELIADEHTSELVMSTLRKYIAVGSPNARLAAWVLVFSLAQINPRSFIALSEELWPDDPLESLEILAVVTSPIPSTYLIGKVKDAILRTSPTKTAAKVEKYFVTVSKSSRRGINLIDHTPIANLRIPRSTREIDIGLFFDEENGSVSLRVDRIENIPSSFLIEPDANIHPDWHTYIVSRQFAAAPNSANLAKALLEIRRNKLLASAKKMTHNLPWPIALLIEEAQIEEQLEIFARSAADGTFGDPEVWRQAEERWQKNGVNERDFLSVPAEELMTSIDTVGSPPLSGFSVAHGSPLTKGIIERLFLLADQIASERRKENIIKIAQFACLGLDDETSTFSAKQFLKFAQQIQPFQFDVSLELLAHVDSEIWTEDSCVELICDMRMAQTLSNTAVVDGIYQPIIEAFNRKTDRRNLLPLIAVFASKEKLIDPKTVSLLDPSAFRHLPTDSQTVRVASCLLDLAQGGRPNSKTVAKTICSRDFSTVNGNIDLRIVNDFFRHDEFAGGAKIQYLCDILGELQYAPSTQLSTLIDIYRKALNSQRSSMTSHQTWADQLHLPVDAYLSLHS